MINHNRNSIEIVAVKNKGRKHGWTIYMQAKGNKECRTYITQAMTSESLDYHLRVIRTKYGIK